MDGELGAEPVATVDEDLLPSAEARRTCRLYFYAGFAALPWFWATNVWLFFPDFLHGRDPVVKRCERGGGRGAPWGAQEVIWGCRGRMARGAQPGGGRPRRRPRPAPHPQTRGSRRSGLRCTQHSSCPGC